MKKQDTQKDSLKNFMEALDEIERTKGIDKEEIISAVEAALVSAYKRDYKGAQNVRVEIDRETGETDVYAQREVVEEMTDELNEISLEEAKKLSLAYELGDMVEFAVDPMDFGRVAAQNAKQLILQRLKESERNIVFDTYLEKKDEIITGSVQRTDRNNVYVNLGKAEGTMNFQNQMPGEQYFSGMRLKVYVSDVVKTNKGSQIYVSRTHPMLIKRLFEMEIPEIFDGVVEIKSIAREAGSRTKIAVYAQNPDIDAVGACVGQKGMRIQNILNELVFERIDVVLYNDDPVIYIMNAISPAQVIEVKLNEETRTALVVVDDSQLSLAIGKEGQNVRLAAKLTGWKIDIKTPEQMEEMNVSDAIELQDNNVENNTPVETIENDDINSQTEIS